MQGGCKDHFLQFSSMIGGNKKQNNSWIMIWLAAVWVIWSSRNNLIFKGKSMEVGELLEQVKIKT